MRFGTTFLCALLTLIAAPASPQATGAGPATAGPSGASVVGVWRGKMDGLPAITLTITDETGALSGAVLFYLIRRDEGKPPTSTPGIPEPILNPSFDGKTLSFQVSHRRAHPPRTLSDQPVSFHLKLTGPDKGELTIEPESSPPFELVRSGY